MMASIEEIKGTLEETPPEEAKKKVKATVKALEKKKILDKVKKHNIKAYESIS